MQPKVDPKRMLEAFPNNVNSFMEHIVWKYLYVTFCLKNHLGSFCLEIPVSRLTRGAGFLRPSGVRASSARRGHAKGAGKKPWQ